jgi:isopenicillin-N N-acyltransferase like protein
MKKIFITFFISLIYISCTTRPDSVVLDTTNPNLPILHLNGTAYENGLQHGKLLQKEINELISLWKQDLNKKYNIPADTFIKIFLDSTNYIPSIKKWTPDLLDEIKGISVGSGIDFNTIFAFQLLDEIWTNARLVNIPHHCTSVGINNYKKNKSSNYIAQNIDIPPLYHGYEILLDIKDKDSDMRKLVTTFAGYIGANGLNNHIGITENTLSDLKSSFNGLPVCFVARGVLEKNTFEEAVNFIKTIKHASGQNYIIGSRREIISLECASDLIVEYWPDKSHNYTYHANRALANTSYHPSNSIVLYDVFQDERFNLMETRIRNNQLIDLSIIKSLLAENPIYNNNTWVSTIMEFENNYNELWIKPKGSDSNKYLILRIEK